LSIFGDAGYLGGTDNDIALTMNFSTLISDAGLTMCVDTNNQITAWEWANGSEQDFPVWDNGLGLNEPRCWEIFEVPNDPPLWCDANGDPVTDPQDQDLDAPLSFNHCAEGSYQLCATDPDEGNPITYSFGPGFETGYGEINGDMWTWSGPTVPQSGNPSIPFFANDGIGNSLQPFTLHVTTTNNAPTIQCPGGTVTISLDTKKSQCVVPGDVDVCDALSLSIISDGGVAGLVELVGNCVEFTPVAGDELLSPITMIVQISDGGEIAECEILWNAIAGAPYQVELEKLPNVLQGHFTDLGIILHKIDFTQGLGGFDLLVAYDASALVFQMATEGDIYGACGWEYFTYRYGAHGNCGNACPSGMLRVIGLAETNNGPNHPGCDSPDPGYVQTGQLPISLAYLRFLVSNDRTLECQYVPVRFFWYDCGDNILSNHDGSEAYLSQKVFDFFEYGFPFEGGEISGEAAFPTFQGAQEQCLFERDEKVAKRNVDFQNGGVDIVCADSIDARGDINLNGLANEIADAVMFTNYFISGLSAFGSHVEGSIAASDVNADGISLSVADLVYLVRVVVGDASPYPKIAPVAATITVGNGRIGVDADMGAAFIKVEGDVTPRLLADNMEMKYNAVDGITNILVYSTEAGESFRGDFLEVSGSIVSTEFATYEGAPVAAKVMPSTFVVEQNYPNPFNPSTKIRFQIPGAGAWELGIYNITGQLVQSFSGNSETGFEEVVWDASDLSSGIYFYRVSTDEHSMTKKAVLLK
jgi:hypothetical protein